MRKAIPFLLSLVLLLAACSAPERVPNTIATDDALTTEPSLTQAESTSPASVPQNQSPEEESASSPQAASEQVSPSETQDGSAGANAARVTYKFVPEESRVTYEVGETFFDQNNRFNTAVGSTTGVTGEIYVDLENPLNSSLSAISVDISTLTSDSGRRDNAIRTRFLESAVLPLVTFVPKEITGLPETFTEGETIAFQVAGDLTIREVSLPAVFDVSGTLQNGAITGTAATAFNMSAYGFGPIQMAGILGTEDEVKVRVDFLARP